MQYYALSPAQNSLFLAQKYSLSFKKTLNTIGTSFFIDRKFDIDILKKAISYAYEKQECLHMHLTKQDDKVVQYIADPTAPEIKILDFSGKSEAYQNKKLEKLTRVNLTKFDSPMSKVYIVHTHDDYNGIYMAVSHVCMDSTAIFAFYRYVYDVYMALKCGFQMPKDPASYTENLKKELAYAGSEPDKSDIAFWEDFYRSHPEPYYTSIKDNSLLEKQRKKMKDPDYHSAKIYVLNSKARHEMCVMPKELVDKCESFCKKHAVSLQSLLFAAQMTYNTAVTGIDNVCLMATCSRRAKLSEKTCGGSRVHFAPYFKKIDGSQKFLDATKEIFLDLCSLFKHFDTDSFSNLARMFKAYGRERTTSYQSMSLTYQPIRVSIPDAKVKMKWYSNGEASNILYMSIMDGNCTGDLYFYYEYQVKHYSAEDIRRSHSGLMKILEKALDNEDITAAALRESVK